MEPEAKEQSYSHFAEKGWRLTCVVLEDGDDWHCDQVQVAIYGAAGIHVPAETEAAGGEPCHSTPVSDKTW